MDDGNQKGAQAKILEMIEDGFDIEQIRQFIYYEEWGIPKNIFPKMVFWYSDSLVYFRRK